MKHLLIPALLLLMLAAPHAHAAVIVTNIWQGAYCGAAAPITADSGPQGPCSFCDALIVGSNLINFAIQASIAITTIMIAYGALRLVLAGGDPGKLSDAKETITRALKGLFWVVAAWMLVNVFLLFLAGASGKASPDWKWYQVTCTP